MIPGRAFVFLVIVLLSAYFIYQARGFILGPQITIFSPKEGEALANGYLLVKGEAANISSLFLNGRLIFVDERGEFEHGLLLASGYNIIEIVAEDNFGREVKERRAVVVKN